MYLYIPFHNYLHINEVIYNYLDILKAVFYRFFVRLHLLITVTLAAD